MLGYNTTLKHILKSSFNFRLDCVVRINIEALIFIVSSFGRPLWFDGAEWSASRPGRFTIGEIPIE
jgi:hypothetical protein